VISVTLRTKPVVALLRVASPKLDGSSGQEPGKERCLGERNFHTNSFDAGLSSWTSLSCKMRPIGYHKTSVQNYRSTLRNIPEERRSHQ
jgi:hypothetical protein